MSCDESATPGGIPLPVSVSRSSRFPARAFSVVIYVLVLVTGGKLLAGVLGSPGTDPALRCSD